MKQVSLELPTLVFIIGTRAALGAGLALLVSAGHPEAQRRRIGRILFAVGAITTVPALVSIIRAVRRKPSPPVGQSAALVGAVRLARKADDDVMPPEWDAADIEEAEEIEAASRD
jgi:hypothetical protein